MGSGGKGQVDRNDECIRTMETFDLFRQTMTITRSFGEWHTGAWIEKLNMRTEKTSTREEESLVKASEAGIRPHVSRRAGPEMEMVHGDRGGGGRRGS